MLARNVIPPHLMRANFPLVSALGVFHALRNPIPGIVLISLRLWGNLAF
jgi:hypothetical protein